MRQRSMFSSLRMLGAFSRNVHTLNTSGLTMNAITFDSPAHSADDLKWAEVEMPTLNSDEEVLLKVNMTAVNRADIVQRRGNYPPPKGVTDVLGLECVGEIVNSFDEQGNAQTDGKNFMALLSGGGYAEFAKVHRDHLVEVPECLTLSEAAAIMEVWLTAFQLLNWKAKIQAGETVLVYGAASGVGTAAIQIIKDKGAQPIAIVGSEKKELFCKELGAVQAINYKYHPDFSAQVKEITNGKGVDVILDCVGGSNFALNQKMIAPGGRWVLYGLMGGNKVSDANLGLILVKNINIMGSTLRSKSDEYKKELIQAFSEYALPKFEDEKLLPIIDNIFSISDVSDAHKHVEANKNVGKVLLKVAGEEFDF